MSIRVKLATHFCTLTDIILTVKSRKQSTIQSPLNSPPFSIQDTKIIEAKGCIKDEIVGKKSSANTNADLIGTWKAASPATRTGERHANTVATPQRNKRKRHAQLEAGKNMHGYLIKMDGA